MNAAIWAGVAEPAMISPIAQAVSGVARSSSRSSAVRRWGQVRSPMPGLPWRAEVKWGVTQAVVTGPPEAYERSMVATVRPVSIGSSGNIRVPSTCA